jgi:hypothetical protein
VGLIFSRVAFIAELQQTRPASAGGRYSPKSGGRVALALRLSMVAPSDYRALSETYFAVLEEHVGTQAIIVQVREMVLHWK